MSTIEIDTRNTALVIYIGLIFYLLYVQIEIVQRDTRAIRNELDAYPAARHNVDVDEDEDEDVDDQEDGADEAADDEGGD